ncbi:hypothetical protein NYE48_27660 [Paenibacillus sp. FSL M7-1455]|uniref:helix-turn-helix domain-containing protein n=1 Tax=Paenibacillus sp. FSL M7-1455 TaxID=2975316 RepID=UPI0030F9ABDF
MTRTEKIQELLDAGHRIAYIAKHLGEHHEVVRRTIKKEKIEVYTAFDEINPHLVEVFDVWDYEDVLDNWDRMAWQGEIVVIPRSSSQTDTFTSGLLKYLKETYGGLREWVEKRKYYSDNFYVVCVKCEKELPFSQFLSRTERLSGINSSCSRCFYLARSEDAHRAAINRRRAYKAELPYIWSKSDRIEMRNCFGDRCYLSDKDDCDDDHFIPLFTGHGGTYLGNMYPLYFRYNREKHTKNPFEWFEANRQRFDLDPSRFDSLVAKLAEQNGLTPEEFREYTYWCFANPRNLTQIKRDNARYRRRVTSVELWREATGRTYETGNRSIGTKAFEEASA